MSIGQNDSTVSLHLDVGLDRALAWAGGRSIRYLVAELSARGPATPPEETPALNLALAIDVSGSMGGRKIEAARHAACAVAEALTPRDRLSVIAFNARPQLLLDAREMDDSGRAAAIAAISSLVSGGGTNLFGGWLMATECVARAMSASPQASPRVLILSDGKTNQGVTDRDQIARHVGALLERGIVTSALGIGNGYDEELLGAIAESGGGNLHDAAQAPEIGEVVLGELQAGRAALAERVALRVVVDVNLRAEIVGAWAHNDDSGILEVMVGSLLPDQTKRVVIRLRCRDGLPGFSLPIVVSARGAVPDGGAALQAVVAKVDLYLAHSADNKAQQRDVGRSLAVVQAWQADAIRRAVGMNRDPERRAAAHFLERELKRLEPYARDVPGAQSLVAELALVQRRVHEAWDERTRKEVYTDSHKRSRSERDLRAAPRASLGQRFETSPEPA